MKNLLVSYIKEMLLRENNNKSPSYLKDGGEAIYKGNRVKIIKADVRGPMVIIKIGEKEKQVKHSDLKQLKDNE